MIYRSLGTLDTGKKIIEYGTVFPESWLSPKAVDALMKKGKLAEAHLPPLAAIPEFQARAARLQKIGIISAGDFLEADDHKLAEALSVGDNDAARFKADLIRMFSTPRQTSG